MSHYLEPTTMMDLFEIASNRPQNNFSLGRPGLERLNIGAGFKYIEATQILDLPKWNAETDPIPYDDETVGVIYCIGMLDHISNVPKFLKECQRVLAPGGTLNISVAHVKSNMAWDDIYHKTWFTEDTWKKIFTPTYWEPDYFEWKLRVNCNMIMGIVERNLFILTQMIREA